VIPRAHVTAWRASAPWPTDAQVEQDLVLSRALYQCRKGRDLYDLWLALTSLALDDTRLVECFERYLVEGGHRISRAEFEANLTGKLQSTAFLEDTLPLLPAGARYDVSAAAALLRARLVERLRGDPWKGG
jgi:uncharacterized membrane protein YccC